MKHSLHRLAHRLGVNRGSPALLKKQRRYYQCFRCECGEVQLVREMSYAEALSWARDHCECGELQNVLEMTYTEALSWARDHCDRWELGPAKFERR